MAISMKPGICRGHILLTAAGLGLIASSHSAVASDLEVAAIKASVAYLTHAVMCQDVLGASSLVKPRELIGTVQILMGESEGARATELKELEDEATDAARGQEASTMITASIT